MEGRREDVAGEAAPPWPVGMVQWVNGRRGGGGGGGGDESDGSSSGVELSLRLRTGNSAPAVAAAEQQHAAARRSMTIFYDGRVCAVDVTEIQAREIISMANQEILAHQRQQHQHHREDRHVPDRGSTTSGAAARYYGGQVTRQTVAAPVSPATGGPRPGLAAMTDQSGLSMKRSLQQFLQKREARRAAAVTPPYAGGGGRQAQAMRH